MNKYNIWVGLTYHGKKKTWKLLILHMFCFFFFLLFSFLFLFCFEIFRMIWPRKLPSSVFQFPLCDIYVEMRTQTEKILKIELVCYYRRRLHEIIETRCMASKSHGNVCFIVILVSFVYIRCRSELFKNAVSGQPLAVTDPNEKTGIRLTVSVGKLRSWWSKSYWTGFFS